MLRWNLSYAKMKQKVKLRLNLNYAKMKLELGMIKD